MGCLLSGGENLDASRLLQVIRGRRGVGSMPWWQRARLND